MNKLVTIIINNILLSGALLFSSLPLLAQPCVIDQPIANAYADISGEAAVGQTFRACATGVVTAIEVYFLDLKARNFKLQMAEGTNTLSPQYIQDFEAKAPGKVIIQLAAPFPVEETQDYAFSIVGVADSNIVAFINGYTENPYAEGNLITEIDGVVTHYESDLMFNLTMVENACALDQPFHNDISNISMIEAVGQNFIACNTGALTMIRVHFDSLDAKALTLQLASGSNTLFPEYTQDFQPDSAGDMIIVLTTPFLVESGQTYAFSVIGLAGAGASLSIDNSEPFTGGNAFVESGGNSVASTADLDFTISVFEEACVLDQPDTSGSFNVAHDIAVGQAFKACVTGFITHIKTSFLTLLTDTLQLQMSAGDNTLTPDYIQKFVPDSVGDYLIQLTTPYRVELNQDYAYSIIGYTDTGVVASLIANNGNNYADGFVFIENGGLSTPAASDLDFSLLTLVCTPSVADFSFTSTELTTSFTNNASRADSVIYDFGDGTTSNDANPTHTYSQSGTYTVSQISFSRCLNDTLIVDVTVNCTPPGAGFNVASINNLSVAFTDTSSVADSVFYDFGDGNTSTTASPQHTYAGEGTYRVTQVAFNSCRNDTAFQDITVSCPASEAGFLASSPNGFSIAFVDNSSFADSVVYDFGDGAISTDLNPTHTYAGPGTYTVCQTTYNECMNNMICNDVTISCGDLVSAFNTIASGNQITVIDSSKNASSVLYDYGDGTITNNHVHTYTESGVFQVKQIVSNACDTDSSLSRLVVNPLNIEEYIKPPEAFTPNGDGINDFWEIQDIDLFPDNDLIILNRWGNQVFFSKSYNNDWAGTSSAGQLLHRGAYFYILRIRTQRPGLRDKTIRGTVTIVY